jgi:hypothetical protein
MSLDAPVFDTRADCMLLACFETIVTCLLYTTLHKIDLQEIPYFLPEEYFVLNFYWISQLSILHNLLSSLDAALVKNSIVTLKYFHHCFEEPSIESKG